MKINFTLSERAVTTIRNMMEYIRTKHDREPLPSINMRDVPGTDTTQCCVEFQYKDQGKGKDKGKESSGPCTVNIQGLPVVIDESDAEELSGMEIDYEDGKFTVKERE